MKVAKTTSPSSHETLHRFKSVKDQFQLDWDAGRNPKIEDYLNVSDEVDREDLLRELLAVEMHRLLCAGDEPNLQKYIDRFPSFVHVVSEQFEAHRSFSIWSNSTATFNRKTKVSPETDQKQSIPKRITDRYRLIELLGRGGFGEVWRAYDEKLHVHVAIKGPRRDRAIPPEMLFLAVTEARKIRQMKCAGFVPVLDVVEHGPLQFIVMELMEGGSLSRFIGKDERPTREQTVRWIAEIAEALHQAHLRGIVHRDIKPANILLNSELRPHIADLGLAVTEEEQLAEPSSSVGTLNYMSPEQAEGKSNLVDARSDIYSLGVLMYHLLTGRVPHLTTRLSDYCRLVQKPGGPRPLRTIDDSIPTELEAICRKCLAYNVNDRYTTAHDLSVDLKAWLNRDQKPAQRRWWAYAVLICITAVLLLTAAATIFWRQSTPSAPVKEERLYFQDLPPEAIQYGVWYGLHQRPPKLLHGIHHPPQNNFRNDNRTKTLNIQCTESTLVALGNARHRNYTFEIDITQSNWRGRCGVFFGYRKTNGEFGSQAKFQLLHIQLHGRPAQQPKLAMYRTVHWVKDNARGDLETVKATEWTMEPVGVPKRITGRLEFAIADGILTDLHWDGDRLPGLCGPEWNNQLNLTSKDYVGLFGVYNFASDGVYQNARIRID